MNKFFALSALAMGVMISANGAEQGGERWRNSEIFEINKEAAHTEFTTYPNRAEALQPLNLENPWHSERYRSLNGVWDFNYYASVDDVPTDWFRPDCGVAKWGSIPVPGTWQSNGYDQLMYTSTREYLVHELDMERMRPEFKGDKMEESLNSGYIPTEVQRVGCYRRWVDVAADELSNSVILRIGAAEAAVEVYVNGEEVGYSQDSFLPAEFDVAKYLKPGRNLIALKVYRWSDGSYLEIQDMHRWSGIYRDVYLKFNTAQSIRDLQFVGVPDKSLTTVDARYSIAVENHSSKVCKRGSVDYELIPLGECEAVKSWSHKFDSVKPGDEITDEGNITLHDMKLWSTDMPNLYTLVATLRGGDGEVIEVVRIDAGFKRFEQVDGNYFLNGKRFFIKGVNRHDHSAESGHYVPLEDLIRDAELMKQNNINTVRTSHYPNDERWYYICNRYGIAMIDEANVESHGFDGEVPGNRPQWFAASVSRVERMIGRDINHPAVLLWSLGNEQGQGWCKSFDLQYDAAKALDPTRFVMCDRGVSVGEKYADVNPVRVDKPDAVTPMYQAIGKAQKYLENRDKDRRPFFMCEYRHAMGNAVGSLKEVWDFNYANEENGLNGGCIWDWVDQGVAAHDENGELYYQYGGDWGEVKSDYNFCLNGLLLSDRRPTPKLYEVKKCYEPFSVEVVDIAKGVFSVRNRLTQQSLECYDVVWELVEDGSVVESGLVEGLNAAPQLTQQFTIPYCDVNMKPESEYYVRVRFLLGDDTVWAKRGFEVTFSEFKVGGDFNYEYTPNKLVPAAKTLTDKVVVTTKSGVEINFDRRSGVLSSLKVKGEELLAVSDRDRLFDHTFAWIDNLYIFRRGKNRMVRYEELALEDLERVGDARVSWRANGGYVVVTVENRYMSEKGAGFKERQEWRIDGLGEIELTESVSPEGELKGEDWIPRVGLRIPLRPSIDNVTYYGLGPFNNEVDRKWSARTGLYSAKVGDMYVDYAFPQDHGNRVDVRWMSLSDNRGRGVKVIGDEKMVMSALPYTQDELQAAKHTIDLPENPTTTELRVAAKVSGVGNGSCGPLTEEEYRATAEAVEYKLHIIPFAL